MLASTIELQNENVLIFEIESVHLNNKIKKGRIFKSVSGVIRKTGYSIIMRYFVKKLQMSAASVFIAKNKKKTVNQSSMHISDMHVRTIAMQKTVLS